MEAVADRYRRLSAKLTERIAAVPEDAWGNPSPCADWNARQLLWHVIDVHGRFQSLVGRSLVGHPRVDQDPLGAFVAVRDQMQADLDDPDKVAQEYEGRFGAAKWGESVDGFVCFDLVVHGWDLARATGQDESIDPADVEWVQQAADARGAVMRENGVIGPVVEVSQDASAQDRLVAALGRRP